MYFIRTPYIIKKLFSAIIWDLPNKENKVYLTFDDGPHPEITPWVLEQLKQYNAKATFFCLGQNAEKYPEIVKQIFENGHVIGNHSYSHLNGWKTKDEVYLEDVMKGNRHFDDRRNLLNSDSADYDEISRDARNDGMLFRPPYGKIKRSQLLIVNRQSSIVNWSLMPGDFDQTISSEKCYSNLTKNLKSGDIICLHDNEKSWKHLEYCLPKFLQFCKEKNLLLTTFNL